MLHQNAHLFVASFFRQNQVPFSALISIILAPVIALFIVNLKVIELEKEM